MSRSTLDTLIATNLADGSQIKAVELRDVETAQADYTDESIAAASASAVPADGSITNVKLATDVKVGSLASLNTTSKSSVVSALNEIKAAAAPLASPTFTGTPTVPTATAGTNTPQAASTAFVSSAVAAVSGGTIADGAVTNAKLATDVKVGSLASLNTTVKSSIVAALNEVKATADAASAGTAVNDSFETLTYSATLSVAYNALRPNKYIDLTSHGNIVINNTGVDGSSSGEYLIKQDATTRVVTVNGTVVSINPAAASKTIIQWIYDGTDYSFDTNYTPPSVAIETQITSLRQIDGLVEDYNFADTAKVTVASGKAAQIVGSVSRSVLAQSDTTKQPPLAVDGSINYADFSNKQFLFSELLFPEGQFTAFALIKRTAKSDAYSTYFAIGDGNGWGFSDSDASTNCPDALLFPGVTLINSETIITVSPQKWVMHSVVGNSGVKSGPCDPYGNYSNTLNSTMSAPSNYMSMGTGDQSKDVNTYISRVVVYNKVLTDAERKIAHKIISNDAGATLVLPVNIQTEGDSITAPQSFINYPEKIYDYYITNGINSYVKNNAVSGSKTTEVLDRINNVVSRYDDRVTNIFTLMIGFNDLNQGTAQFNTSITMARVIDICQRVRKVGYKVVVQTVLNNATSGTQTRINDFNSRLRINYTEFADALHDAQAIPHAADPTNTTYYSDGTHPTAVLAQEIADSLRAVITTII